MVYNILIIIITNNILYGKTNEKNKVNYSWNSGNWESGQPIRGTVLHRDDGHHGSFKAQACNVKSKTW